MENQVVRFEPQNVRNEVVKQIEQMRTSKFVQLPENYKESAFFAIEKLANLPDIEKVPTISVTKALISMFGNNLDFRKNHCYFFVQNDKNSQTGKSLRFGWQYQGLISVAKATCGVKDVVPVLVYENDIFSANYEYGELLITEHKPTFEGKIIGGYCVVRFEKEADTTKYYTRAELDKRRDKSMYKNGQFWTWEREMYEKTLINATLKRIIETSGAAEAEGLYDEPEEKQPRQVVDVQAEVIEQPEPTETAQIVEPKKFEM